MLQNVLFKVQSLPVNVNSYERCCSAYKNIKENPAHVFTAVSNDIKMLILLIVVLLNVWTIPVENVMTPNINILKELMDLEIRMKSMETEMERLKTEKEGMLQNPTRFTCPNLYIIQTALICTLYIYLFNPTLHY